MAKPRGGLNKPRGGLKVRACHRLRIGRISVDQEELELCGGSEQLFDGQSENAEHEMSENLGVTPDADETSSETVLGSGESSFGG